MTETEFDYLPTPLDHANAQHDARTLRRFVDGISLIRFAGSVATNIATAFMDRSWPITVVDTALAGSDMLDGKGARRINPILEEVGLPPEDQAAKEHGGRLDNAADRVMVYGKLVGWAVRSLVKKDYSSAATAATVAATGVWRDGKMNATREVASDNGISTNAIKINKWKAALQMFGLITVTSPLAEYAPVRRVGKVALLGGTVLGLIGWKKYDNQVNQQLAKRSPQS